VIWAQLLHAAVQQLIGLGTVSEALLPKGFWESGSESRAGRCPSLSRTFVREVAEDFGNNSGVQYERDDPHLASAVARQRIDLVDSPNHLLCIAIHSRCYVTRSVM